MFAETVSSSEYDATGCGLQTARQVKLLQRRDEGGTRKTVIRTMAELQQGKKAGMTQTTAADEMA